MSNYWEEQQLKQMGMSSMIEQSETKPDPKFGEPALEVTLNNIKETLWNVEHNTQQTQSRLDKNNQSGPSHYAQKISNWSAERYVLDIMTETLVEIRDELEGSAIAKHSDSPLETSLAKINTSIQSVDPSSISPSGSTAVTTQGGQPAGMGLSWMNGVAQALTSIDGGVKTIIKEHKKTRRLLGEGFFGKKKSAEEQSEGVATAKNEAIREEKQTGFLKGMWEHMKDKKKDSWLVKNWGKILIAIGLLFLPLKHIVKLWEWFKTALAWSAKHPLIAAILALTAYFTGGAFIKAMGLLLLRKTGAGASNLWQKARAGSHMTAGQKALSASRSANASLPGPRVGKAVPLGRKVSMKAASMAQSTKGIFGSIVEKFGKAGKWLKQLGSKLIMPLVTTPAGWAILAGLAIGGLIYTFWDDIKSGISKAFAFLTGAIDSIKDKFASIDISGWMKKFIKNMPWPISKLASLFGASKAEAAEDEPVGPIGAVHSPGASSRAKERIAKAKAKRNKRALIKAPAKSQSLASTSAYTSPTQGQGMGSAVIKSQQNKPDDMNSYKGEKGVWSLVGNDWIFYSDRQADETAVKIPFGHDKSAFKKQTSLGDRFKNLGKWLWGDKKADEKKGAEPATTAISKPPLSDFKSPLSKIRGKGSLLLSDKRADDYIAGMNANKPVGMPFKELDSDQKAELFDFGKTLGVSKKQIEGGYFNYSSALDSSPKGYGAAQQRISAAQSPDEKMNTFNSVQKENLAAQNQPSSPVVISQVDGSQKTLVAPKVTEVYPTDTMHDAPVPVGVSQ